MDRYVLKLDADRKAAGWGLWYWIVDTHAPDGEQLLELLPAYDDKAQRRVNDLNRQQG